MINKREETGGKTKKLRAVYWRMDKSAMVQDEK